MNLNLRSVSRLQMWLTASVIIVALLGIVQSATAAKIDLSGGDDQVTLEYQDATRRDVLNKVLEGRAIKIKWIDEDFAREQISGRLVGSFGSGLVRSM